MSLTTKMARACKECMYTFFYKLKVYKHIETGIKVYKHIETPLFHL